MELQLDDGPRSSLGIGPGSDDVVGSRRRSLGDSPKGSGSSVGTRRKKTRRLIARMPKAAGLTGLLNSLRPAQPRWERKSRKSSPV
ncbi:hypothetical protein GW17_00035772 [Ensete ventricosum]|nr:hypothetical protein GW17_00035772 [Ensete ventricosum]